MRTSYRGGLTFHRFHRARRFHLIEVVGSDKVVLGTDYPFDMGVTHPAERATAANLPAADLTAILSGNAAALFGLATE